MARDKAKLGMVYDKATVEKERYALLFVTGLVQCLRHKQDNDDTNLFMRWNCGLGPTATLAILFVVLVLLSNFVGMAPFHMGSHGSRVVLHHRLFTFERGAKVVLRMPRVPITLSCNKIIQQMKVSTV